MNKAIEYVFATAIVSFFDKNEMPKDQLDSMIKNELARGLSEHIVQHLTELPVVVEKESQISTYCDGGDKYTMRVNLISNEEIRRLKDIEYKYAEIMHKQEEFIRRRNEPVSEEGGWLNEPLTEGKLRTLNDEVNNKHGIKNEGR